MLLLILQNLVGGAGGDGLLFDSLEVGQEGSILAFMLFNIYRQPQELVIIGI